MSFVRGLYLVHSAQPLREKILLSHNVILNRLLDEMMMKKEHLHYSNGLLNLTRRVSGHVLC
jgi:hypothetical protein